MSGSLWLGGDEGQDTLPFIPRQRPPGAATDDPLAQLALRLKDLISIAVHPDEIAAIIESDGMTDAQIRAVYGHPDSFSLAEALYARVPRRYPATPAPPPEPWRAHLGSCLLRGLVFALPGLAYVLGAPLLAGPPATFGLPAGTMALLAGTVTGWVWNQSLSHRAHSWLSLADRPAAVRALRLGAPLGAALSALAALAASEPGDLSAAAFAAGQCCYLAAATALLVLGRERALCWALLPLTLGVVPGLPSVAGPLLLLGSLTAAVTLAVRTLCAETAGPRPGGAIQPRLTTSVPYGLFGLGAGVLVLYAALGDIFRHGSTGTVAGPSAVALTLSMGPAEWLLHRFRAQSLAGLRSSSSARGFRGAVTVTVTLCLGAYLLVLAALAEAGTRLWPDAPALSGLRLATLLLIGAVLWTGLLLQSFGAAVGAAAVCCAAAVAQTLALLLAAPPTTGLVVSGSAAALLAVLACVLLGRATAHRP
ncbi:hypothetical protein [Streptomyces sp. NBC_00083]|uniref:hypothetical protein n=1 Tax=Streptomyces sp. NBC_00083 TaxID=2975647 RepID=UPI0022562067|nr:hypothetical protein [Streptomyces sp. NBC_00083]MCX5382875.1 hypothetical protein [Streptomyces sp. NBC_00083]